jgi:hypothetical protein
VLPVTLWKRLGKGDQYFFLHWIYWACRCSKTVLV